MKINLFVHRGIYGAGNFFYARQEGEFVYSSLVAQFDTTKNTLLGKFLPSYNQTVLNGNMQG